MQLDSKMSDFDNQQKWLLQFQRCWEEKTHGHYGLNPPLQVTVEMEIDQDLDQMY